ncbi:MAG: nicotinamide riboside transporter PnuC [Pseudomonadota bacterium]
MNLTALVSYLDPIAAILSVFGVMAFVRLKRSGWALEVVATVLKAVLYYICGMYGQVGLKCIFIVMMFYGWYRWKYPNKAGEELKVRSLTRNELVVFALLCGISMAILGYVLNHYTDSTVPYLDAFITIVALCTKYMLCNKIIEHWLLGIVSSIVTFYTHASVGLPFHAAIHVAYPVIAFLGYRKWRAEMKGNNNP